MRHGAECRPNRREKSCRSLHWSSGLSKKTQPASDHGVPCGSQPTQVAVGHHRLAAPAVAARGGAHGGAQVGKLNGAWGEELGELHVRSVSDPANRALEPPHFGGCNKLLVSIRRIYQRSTERVIVEKPVFKTRLNNRKWLWNIWVPNYRCVCTGYHTLSVWQYLAGIHDQWVVIYR